MTCRGLGVSLFQNGIAFSGSNLQIHVHYSSKLKWFVHTPFITHNAMSKLSGCIVKLSDESSSGRNFQQRLPNVLCFWTLGAPVMFLEFVIPNCDEIRFGVLDFEIDFINSCALDWRRLSERQLYGMEGVGKDGSVSSFIRVARRQQRCTWPYRSLRHEKICLFYYIRGFVYSSWQPWQWCDRNTKTRTRNRRL